MVLMFSTSAMSGCQNRNAEIILNEQTSSDDTESSQNEEDPADDPIEGASDVLAISETPEQPEHIFVDVCGAVSNPGVYELEAESRVFQVIEAAGGFLPEAEASAVNQALPVSDGQQIYVPTKEEAEEGDFPAQSAGTEPTGTDAGSDAGMVNINTADISGLTTLSGIGEAKAQAIITYREEHGGFSSIEEIMQVPGIKENTFLAIKDKIAVK